MPRIKRGKPEPIERDKIARDRLRMVGALDPYADADAGEVEERLRNMTYGATNSRVTKLRRAESDST